MTVSPPANWDYDIHMQHIPSCCSAATAAPPLLLMLLLLPLNSPVRRNYCRLLVSTRSLES